jgi:hypothetical protein
MAYPDSKSLPTMEEKHYEETDNFCGNSGLIELYLRK